MAILAAPGVLARIYIRYMFTYFVCIAGPYAEVSKGGLHEKKFLPLRSQPLPYMHTYIYSITLYFTSYRTIISLFENGYLKILSTVTCIH